jgi:hypothetical protein
MTTRPIEAVYREIAELMSAAISEPWAHAWIVVSLEGETSLRLTGWYERTDAEAPRNFAVPLKATRDLAELRRRIHGPDGQTWTKGTFHLNSDGKFRLDLEYS